MTSVKFTAQKRENDFRIRVSKKGKLFRVLFLRFRVSKTRNGNQALHTLPNVTSVTKRYRALQSVTYFILQKTLNGLL